MKKSVIVAALALSLFAMVGMGGNKQEPPKPQFGVVESAKLYQDSKVGKAGVDRLEKLQNDALAKLETMQADLKKAQEAKDDATAQRLQVEMQGSLYNMQSVLTAEQDKVVATIRTAMEKCMEKYRTEHGMFGLFSDESMLSYGKDVNVTAGIMELLDKENVDFGPLPSLDAPAIPKGVPSEALTAPEKTGAPKADAPKADAPKGNTDKAAPKTGTAPASPAK